MQKPRSNGSILDRLPLIGDNRLSPLGEKIFLDRYALKDGSKSTLQPNDLVVALVDSATGQREIGTAQTIAAGQVQVVLRDGTSLELPIEHVDKPVELTVEQMMDRAARGAAAVETDEHQQEWAENFRWLLDGWKFVPGGRILTACGTDQNLTFYNCYVVPSPRDSRDGIIETLSQMAEIMSRGGGVGINLSTLRPRFAYVKGVNGRSSGSVSWGGLYSFVTGLIEQGGSRRGALMLILNVWHPDVLEFIKSKREMGKIVNANISVGVTDDFMEAVEKDGDWSLVFPDTSDPRYSDNWNGDINAWKALGGAVITHKTMKAREIWNGIIESAWASAEPGLWFIDRSNKEANSWYYPEGRLICTNPCVTGDTLLSTEQGLQRAGDLWQKGGDVRVLCDSRLGEDTFVSGSAVFSTGVKPVFRLKTREGFQVRLTQDHKVRTEGRGWVPAGELQSGDQILVQDRAGAFGTEGNSDLGRVLGWLVGDGHLKGDRAVLSFFGEKEGELAQQFAESVNRVIRPASNGREYQVGTVAVAERAETRVSSARLLELADEHGLAEDKLRVPESVLRGTREMQQGFLQALYTADGHVEVADKSRGAVVLSSISETLLRDVQRLLLNFGIYGRIYTNRHGEGGTREMPDGQGGSKAYPVQPYHDLRVQGGSLHKFQDHVGFLLEAKQERLQHLVGRYTRGPYTESFLATFVELAPEGEEMVFDLQVPGVNAFCANGLVVHNCGEQPLPAWAVCNLGHLNLSRLVKDGDVDWETLGRTVRYAVRFLDNVIDATPYFFEENANQQKSERRVGLGTIGLAEMMIRLKIRYGSPESEKFLDKLYQFIASEAYGASIDLAAEKGSFPKFESKKFLQSGFMKRMPEEIRKKVAEKGIRNVTLLTQAPTGTVGTMVGTSTGIEPFYFWSYFRKSRLGVHEEKVRVLEEWQELHPGQQMPDYFVNAMDLTPEEHVRVQAATQKWVDSAISKTCNVPSNYTVDQTRQLYELMYRLGCKGGTIYRDKSRDEQVLNLKPEAPKEEPKPVAAVEKPKVRPRPYKRKGVTVSKATPAGTAHITMNDDEEGRPFEMFIELGKGGSDIKAMAEALGRLASLVLRVSSPLSPKERVSEIVNQLRGIGGPRSMGFGKARVRSLPDALSQALEENYLGAQEEQDVATPAYREAVSGEGEAASKHTLGMEAFADLCPECGNTSFVYTEGCTTCYSCGHSEC